MKSIINNAIKIVAILIFTSSIVACSKTDGCPEKYVEVYKSGQIDLIIDTQEPKRMNLGQKTIYKDCEVSNVEVHAVTDVTIRFEGAIIELKTGDIKDLK
ncbi:hypothetical protein [Sphingobacterium cellulitidis]|uniref:Auto-transporter adhesin head GIN domain-containing protein n=1 Tax=Sphingobacterium cellulitidis TaxID=1768011 RepID=A0A8H9KVK1_9SPHI|nr:hypothetical protein [Sphingobacterium soli]MBA8986462.1 hypothetical protein [Sphingobacterium soli]GGE20438.1 hypothetical protein GCM10011516_17580 [Sphingobacterium soli]